MVLRRAFQISDLAIPTYNGAVRNAKTASDSGSMLSFLLLATRK